ncbi:MAG: DUF721 domain-containing protein [Cyanobacteriota bacterium]|nr:DUF721 domain-containing protein [Cyanobacteriota bacterium]
MLSSLDQVLQQVQRDPHWADYRLLGRVTQIWPQVVGVAVSAHTHPVSIQKQVLQVATSTSAWAQNLAFQRPLILSKLNAALSASLRDIRFSPAEWHRQALSHTPPSLGRVHEPARAKKESVEDPAATPQEAFERWARHVKQTQLKMPPCPQCRCPAPEAELNRWYVCGYCWSRQPQPGIPPHG